MEEMKLYDINSIEFNELMDSARMQLKDSNSEYKELRKKAQPSEEIKLFQREIYGIANNINQISKVANSRYSVSHDDYNYISKTLADFILRFERKIYSRQR